MNSSRHITLYTMLGSLPEISKIHIRSLSYVKTENFNVVALGSRDKKNDEFYKKLFEESGINSKIFDREKLNTKPPYDGMYDVMMSKIEPKDIFILAHDDCIFGKNCNILELIRDKLKENDFCLKLENNSDMRKVCDVLKIQNSSIYKKILVKGKSMHDIRFGTWFLAGNYSCYKKNKLNFGDQKKIMPFLYNILKKDFNVMIKAPYIYIDGGFNFNLEIHRLGLKYFLIDDKVKIRHLVHATHFFSKKGIEDIGEPKDWEDRWKKMITEKKSKEVSIEKKYLLYLNKTVKNLGYEIKKLNCILENSI